MQRGELLEAITDQVEGAIGGMDEGDRAAISITLKLLPTETLQDIWKGEAWEAVAISAGVLAAPMEN